MTLVLIIAVAVVVVVLFVGKSGSPGKKLSTRRVCMQCRTIVVIGQTHCPRCGCRNFIRDRAEL